jgi:tripartite ATP-independent transporter DctM subunit
MSIGVRNLSEAPPPGASLARLLRPLEDGACVLMLLSVAAVPVAELVLRNLFAVGLPGASGFVQNFTLWVGFLGAMVASREGRHLRLATASSALPTWIERLARPLVDVATLFVALALAGASLQFVQSEMASPDTLGPWLPIWTVLTVLPLSFLVIALRAMPREGPIGARALVVAIAVFGAVAFLQGGPISQNLLWGGVLLLGLSAILGAPIFVLLGGLALLFLQSDGIPVAAIPVETYRIAVSPLIPTIPLFTLTGFILAESGAGERLVRLFRALFGWVVGGPGIATTLVCAFFASFTGASGVTILALGGLLLPVLLDNGYSRRRAIGLLTATGSIGLLFPPSLAVILYAVVAKVPIPDLFLASLVPGLLMVIAVSALGAWFGRRGGARATPFSPREALAAIWQAKWDLLLPVVILVGIFGGLTTLIEAAAISVVYTIAVGSLVHRELGLRRDLPGILLRCSALVGGVFVILACAMGLTSYLVDAEVPMRAADWVAQRVSSPLLFLLALNLFLLLLGCLMDIYSAIAVAVPLILPISQVFGINPVHLGVVFLVNLELGYLTPPVGMNLFLASYRFERPLTEVCKSALPYLAVLAGVLVVVTYLPGLLIGVG